MGGHDYIAENDPNYNFKGWRGHFNTFTLRGRRNFTIATYSACVLAYFYFSRKGNKAVEAPPAKKT